MRPFFRRFAQDRQAVPGPETPLYSVLEFRSRSAAVRFCLDVGDALADARWITESGGDRRATVWLAADTERHSFQVFACDRALAAARAAGLESVIADRVQLSAMPAVRCLVIGDTAGLSAH